MEKELHEFLTESAAERLEMRVRRKICGGMAVGEPVRYEVPARHQGLRMQHELLAEWDLAQDRSADQLFEQVMAGVAQRSEPKNAWVTTLTEKDLRKVMTVMERSRKRDEALRRRVEQKLGPMAPVYLGQFLYQYHTVSRFPDPENRCPFCGAKKRGGLNLCIFCGNELRLQGNAGDR